MRITCPSCAAEYELGATLAAGRVVQCARCGHRWAPVPAEPPPVMETVPAEAMPEPASAPVVEVPPPSLSIPPDGRPAPVTTAPPRAQSALTLAWIGSGVVLAGLLAFAFLFRAPIMQAWPPSTRLYAALGLA